MAHRFANSCRDFLRRLGKIQRLGSSDLIDSPVMPRRGELLDRHGGDVVRIDERVLPVESKTLDIPVGGENGPAGAFAIAFLFGFAGERLITRVLGSLDKQILS
jgi:hypothetical protein